MNLVGLDYAANGASAFNAADGRGLLLQYRDFFDYFTATRNFCVQPAVAWLFGWGDWRLRC